MADQDDLLDIRKIIEEGHTRPCACRQILGDGTCECKMGVVSPVKLARDITAMEISYGKEES
ncbi:MAG: hypothetical protein ACLQF0_06215 [Dissulfurispiraceae bacterium]